jgi:RNA polymerase sigma-70 factor (ECF subfamily)
MQASLEPYLEAARNGDRQAFEEVVKRLQQPVFRYCYPMLGSRQDAEDVVQETFIRAYRHLHRYRESGQFSGWLFTIAHRLCLNKLKSRSRIRTLMRRLTAEGDAARLSETAAGIADDALAMLDGLKPVTRAIVVLKVLHGLSFEEIARICGLPPATLRKRYERAKKQLQREHSIYNQRQMERMDYECT